MNRDLFTLALSFCSRAVPHGWSIPSRLPGHRPTALPCTLAIGRTCRDSSRAQRSMPAHQLDGRSATHHACNLCWICPLANHDGHLWCEQSSASARSHMPRDPCMPEPSAILCCQWLGAKSHDDGRTTKISARAFALFALFVPMRLRASAAFHSSVLGGRNDLLVRGTCFGSSHGCRCFVLRASRPQPFRRASPAKICSWSKIHAKQMLT